MNPENSRKPFDPLTPRNPDRNKVDNRVRGLSKSMRNVKDLEKEYKKNRNLLTQDEKRLLDLITFQKTGKHIDEFKEPTEKKPKVVSKKIKILDKDPLDPNTIVDDALAQRIAERASQSVS